MSGAGQPYRFNDTKGDNNPKEAKDYNGVPGESGVMEREDDLLRMPDLVPQDEHTLRQWLAAVQREMPDVAGRLRATRRAAGRVLVWHETTDEDDDLGPQQVKLLRHIAWRFGVPLGEVGR